MSINPKQLTSNLLGKKIVNVKNSNGELVEFEIQKVNIVEFAGEGMTKLSNIVGRSEEEIRTMFVDKFKSREIAEVISPALLAGVANPTIANKDIKDCDLEKEVPLKVLLIDLELASNLYMEIIKISIKEVNK